MHTSLTDSALGKKSAYKTSYDASLLFPIPRMTKREEIAIPTPLPFDGHDQWHAYEISWLNSKGKPIVMMGTFLFPASSSHIIESKSFKLYLNSFNNTRFLHTDEVVSALKKDLSASVLTPIDVTLTPLPDAHTQLSHPPGISLDTQDIPCDSTTLDPTLLSAQAPQVTETLFSDLLKSNCLVTHQPDWGTIIIHYTGDQIDHAGLLQYIVSLRDHDEFHEQCVERIFMDILRHCQPTQLSVEARYTRRGGLDINPLRHTPGAKPEHTGARLVRQ